MQPSFLLTQFHNLPVHVWINTDGEIYVNGTELCQKLSNADLLKLTQTPFEGKWIVEERSLTDFVEHRVEINYPIKAIYGSALSDNFSIQEVIDIGYFHYLGHGTPAMGIYIPDTVATCIIMLCIKMKSDYREQLLLDMISENQKRIERWIQYLAENGVQYDSLK